MPYSFRLLSSRDLPAIVDHLLGLDRDDRVLRFSNPAPDAAIRDYCSRWHFGRDVVMGAFEGDRLVGLIHLPVYDEPTGAVGEIGVSVAADSRSRGIATQIAARVVLRARRLGLARVYIHFLTRNRPMGLLARAFTDDVTVDEDESHARITVSGDAIRRAIRLLRLGDAKCRTGTPTMPGGFQRRIDAADSEPRGDRRGPKVTARKARHPQDADAALVGADD
jgi:GNAT superfamily N-acetyltransferase